MHSIIKMTSFQVGIRLRQAVMHPTVHEIIMDRIDEELMAWDLPLDDRFKVLYYITVGDTPSAIHNLSAILPSENGDIRKDRLLLIVDFALSQANRIKAIKSVRIPRRRPNKKEPT